MNAATVELHRTIIRLLKGILTAWERWLNRLPQASQTASGDTDKV